MVASLCLAAAMSAPQPITAADLVSIVDIGIPDPKTGLALSPDRAFAAFETRRANLERNRVEIRWIVLPLDGRSPAIDVGDGGFPQLSRYKSLPEGRHIPELPQWSPDSKWIAYRVERDREIQLWRSRSDGALQEQLTHSGADVQEFKWTEKGDRILYKTHHASREELKSAREAEASRGYLYDDRYSVYSNRAPLPDEPDESSRQIWAYDLSTRRERPASADEIREFDAPRPAGTARAEDLRADRELGLNPPVTIVSNTHVCRHAECYGHFQSVSGSDDDRRVYFVRYIDPNEFGPMAVYVWTPRTDDLRVILKTDGLLKGCSHVEAKLICGYETATHPARIVSIDLRDGVKSPLSILYDPNPTFETFTFGDIEALRWTDQNGSPGFGHLVKPVGYQPGRRYPLIIVQYRSRGFLRGGAGDEYPIHLFAAHGFAVLSFHRPEDRELSRLTKTFEEHEARGWIGERDRRLVLAALEAGLDKLDAMGVIDSARVGLTGLSDGGETVSFALIHAPERFAAAAASWSIYSPTLPPLMGPKFRREFHDWNIHWDNVALSLNADRVRAPLLLQVSDGEVLPETDTVAALQAHEKPVEMHVFPDEGHIKWQPAHRYAIYRRSLQWFLFWLQGIEVRDPLDERQYSRWRQLRAQACNQSSAAMQASSAWNWACRTG